MFRRLVMRPVFIPDDFNVWDVINSSDDINLCSIKTANAVSDDFNVCSIKTVNRSRKEII